MYIGQDYYSHCTTFIMEFIGLCITLAKCI